MPAASRPVWKGYLRLSLVTIAVELYSAVEPPATALHQIHRPSGKRVRYQKVVPGAGPVDAIDVATGVPVAPGAHVLVEPEEIAEFRIETATWCNSSIAPRSIRAISSGHSI